MKAAAGFRREMIQVIPLLMTRSMTKSLILPRTRSSRSETRSWIHCHRPAMPLVARVLKTSTVCSIRATIGSPTTLATRARMLW
jgi:hypothetical protein